MNFVFFLSKQIRQEKPYYIADPEVDSLVSYNSNSLVVVVVVVISLCGLFL